MKRFPYRALPRGPLARGQWHPPAAGRHCRLVRQCKARAAYTLIEMLMSVMLTLILMAFVVQIFGVVGDSINDARATLEINEQLRSATARLRLDLQNVTAEMTPPLSPESGKGYFELIEGPIGPQYAPTTAARNTNDPAAPVADSTVIDNDDILMFTVRSPSEPFVGRALVRPATGASAQRQSIESPLAEVCWFVRGTTLYRRVLLVKPDFDCHLGTPIRESLSHANLIGGPGPLYTMPDAVLFVDLAANQQGFYNNFDLSVRLEGYDPSNPGVMTNWRWVPNTLADLTKRENRFAHQPSLGGGMALAEGFPFHPHTRRAVSGGPLLPADWRFLGLPTLRECSWCADATNPTGAWWPGIPLPVITLASIAPFTAVGEFDAWNNPLPYDPVTLNGTATALDRDTGTIDALAGPRVAEDVILTNVIGFDVKVWDPGAPILSFNGGAARVPGDPGYPPWDDNLASPPNDIVQKLQGIFAGWTILGYGAYVDLDYAYRGIRPDGSNLATVKGLSYFSGPPNRRSQVTLTYANGVPLPGASSTYDTWSTHYEKDGINENSLVDAQVDEGANGFDDIEDANGIDSDGDGVVSARDGIVDDAGEQEAPPPYAVPLRAVQIKIRVFEPDSRQVREVTILQDFLPE